MLLVDLCSFVSSFKCSVPVALVLANNTTTDAHFLSDLSCDFPDVTE